MPAPTAKALARLVQRHALAWQDRQVLLAHAEDVGHRLGVALDQEAAAAIGTVQCRRLVRRAGGSEAREHAGTRRRRPALGRIRSGDLARIVAGSDVGRAQARVLERAYAGDPQLAAEAATGRTQRAIQTLQREAELRADPQVRADRFVERWRRLDRQSLDHYRVGDMTGYAKVRDQMGATAEGLARDAQLESLLRNRVMNWASAPRSAAASPTT